MDITIMVIAWAMGIMLVIGALSGWLLFVVAWLLDLRSSGRFSRFGRFRRTSPPAASRRPAIKQIGGSRHPPLES